MPSVQYRYTRTCLRTRVSHVGREIFMQLSLSDIQSVVASDRKVSFSRVLPRLFGVRLLGDMHERCSELGIPLPQGQKRMARHEMIREAGVLFIHVPKNAGTAVCRTLYGQELEHRSIRYFRRSVSSLSGIPSVAIIRDPVDRFISAYRHAKGGGGRHRDLAETFAARYMAFRSLDDALDHVERATDWYDVDHIFRPQSWYVTDGRGKVIVDRLFHITELQALSRHLFPSGRSDIPRLNDSVTPFLVPTRRQTERIQALYSRDYEIQKQVLTAG